MKSFFECNAFGDKEFEVKEEFSVYQQELLLKSMGASGAVYEKLNVEYVCKLRIDEKFNPQKPTIIISIHNYFSLLEKTINNLKEKNILNHCNLFIVDDRSEDDIEKLALDYSYMRVDSTKGFNFSMLNNIPALIVDKLGGKQIILWNSDLWAHSESYFLQFLERHNSTDSFISGSKLLYPPKEISFIQEEDSANIKEFFPGFSGKWRNKVQFAGISWIPRVNNPIFFIPNHYRRFSDHEDFRVNCDKPANALTGALMIIDLKKFIEIGGLNPSLSKNLQDIDICLKADMKNYKCYYFGKDIFFYHDESILLSENKIGDKQLKSDEILFAKIWNDKIFKVLL